MSVRGFGIGMSIMPAMTAAFSVLRPEQVNDATPQLNVLQRVGGSLGTAIFAVVLQGQTQSAHTTAARGRRVRPHLLVGDGRDAAGAGPDASVGPDRAAGQGDHGRGTRSRSRRGAPAGGSVSPTTATANATPEPKPANKIDELRAALNHLLAADRRLRGRDHSRPGELTFAQLRTIAALGREQRDDRRPAGQERRADARRPSPRSSISSRPRTSSSAGAAPRTGASATSR